MKQTSRIILVAFLAVAGLVVASGMAVLVSESIDRALPQPTPPPSYSMAPGGKRVQDSIPSMSAEEPAVIEMNPDSKIHLLQGKKATAPPVPAPDPGAVAKWDD